MFRLRLIGIVVLSKSNPESDSSKTLLPICDQRSRFLECVLLLESVSDSIFDDSRTTHMPANDKNPMPADIIGSQTKFLWAG